MRKGTFHVITVGGPVARPKTIYFTERALAVVPKFNLQELFQQGLGVRSSDTNLQSHEM